MPAHYKKLLDEKYPNRYFVTSDDGRFARMYPMELWEQVESRLQGNDFDPLRQEVQRKLNLMGDEAEMDSQGRLLLPQFLRETLGLSGDVHVIGMGSRLEICNQAVGKELIGRTFDSVEKKEMSGWNL